MSDTIVALSSGRPPAAIAVLRVSGPRAMETARALARALPEPRRAGLRALYAADGGLLDRALVLVFPGPDSATGEDVVELQCHGGQAVVEAVEGALLARGEVRRAEPGEFTRRALLNDRIDLAQAQGLADLLEAETETQRRAALMASEGKVSRAVRGWLDRLLAIAALVEAGIEFSEEDDVAREGALQEQVRTDMAALRTEIEAVTAIPSVDRIRDGVRVVIGGPPNSGKSTLLNLMTGRDAAIVSPISGTTRDRVEAPVRRSGIAYLLTDTAGLIDAADPVERIGVVRAQEAIAAADLLLWLGDDPPPRDSLWVHARADVPGRETMPAGRVASIRQDAPGGVEQLWAVVEKQARALLPSSHDLPLRAEQQRAVRAAAGYLTDAADPLILAEQLRLATGELGALLGVNATEAMLDALFSRFCLGK